MNRKNRTLIIGDTHLENKYPGQLKAQTDFLLKIIKDSRCEEIIFLGDIFEKRNPLPSIVLGFLDFLGDIYSLGGNPSVTIIRGNHDSETKADDGVTILSIFKYLNFDEGFPNVHVRNETFLYPSWCPLAFIPHYENQQKILSDLEKISKEGKIKICFGHFGFDGCLNSTGHPDFSIPLSAFTTKTYLGHIHNFNKANEKVTVVGTPYSTSFSESGKQNYVIKLTTSNNFETVEEEVIKLEGGPRFLTIPYSKLEQNREFIEDPKYHTFLRVTLNGSDIENTTNLEHDLEKRFSSLPYVETRILWTIDKKDTVSDFIPDKKLLDVTDDIIKDYVKNNSVGLSYDKVMEGYDLLKDET